MSILSTGRAPLSSLSVPFGLSGLAGTWSMAAQTALAPAAIAEVFWLLAALAWIVVVANYLVRSRNAGGSIARDLQDPVQSPFAALAPTAAMLIGAHYASIFGSGWMIATVIFAVIAALYGAWFLTQLVLRERSVDALHAGYLLPTVAATLIIGLVAGGFGWTVLAEAAFAVGILFWLVFGGLILARMAFRPAPPAALLPTFAIFSAPPAVAGNAWFAITGGQLDSIQIALLGTFVMLALVQFMMLGTYWRLPFTLGFWAFTFTAAASATYAVHWLALWAGPGYQVWSWVAVGAATLLIGSIAVRTVGTLRSAHRASRAAVGSSPDVLAPQA